MKIALFSDIHANFPAFEAVLDNLERQEADAVYCLGDLVGYHISPNEVINEIRKRHIPTISGNHDQKVIGPESTPDEISKGDKKYAYRIITQDNRDYLGLLPAHIKLEYKLDNKNLTIVLAHGSTRRVDEYVLIDTDEDYVLELMEEAGADILCVGHSHKPYHRKILDKNGLYKHVINLGSVGKPKDGDPRGCYVILELNEKSSSEGKDSIKVSFMRVAYDIEKSVKEILDSPLPDEFAEALRLAK